MTEFELTTPVGFIIFNRPNTTARVFKEISRARPSKLLVVCDGPRLNHQDDISNVAAAREIIERVDWPCEVFTNYSEVNLGCKRRVSSGIDWIFEQVEEAIILEDDCLPDFTFFRFCQEMLDRYRYDQRIGMISGDNFQFGFRLNDDSYYFSNNSHIWGWATWRDRWQHDYDVDMNLWPKLRGEGRILDWACKKDEQDYLTKIYDSVFRGEIDTWDYQWNFASRCNGRISVMPNHNLISNIGFGAEATHTKQGSLLANMRSTEMYFPLNHPAVIFASSFLDSRYFSRIVENTFSSKAKRLLSRIFF